MLSHNQTYAFSLCLTEAYCVVEASGELDIASVAGLRAAVRVARLQRERVVIDLRGVEFMDSFALRALVSLQAGDRHFHVIAGEHVQRVLDITDARAALRWMSPEQLTH
jgi:anti-anti-sigma factor